MDLEWKQVSSQIVQSGTKDAGFFAINTKVDRAKKHKEAQQPTEMPGSYVKSRLKSSLSIPNVNPRNESTRCCFCDQAVDKTEHKSHKAATLDFDKHVRKYVQWYQSSETQNCLPICLVEIRQH